MDRWKDKHESYYHQLMCNVNPKGQVSGAQITYFHLIENCLQNLHDMGFVDSVSEGGEEEVF